MVLMRPGLTTELTGRAQGGMIILRHPRWADYEMWSDLRRANADYLKPWEPDWSSDHLGRVSYRQRLGRFKKFVTQDRAYPFHVFRAEDDQLIGACNLTHIDRGPAQTARLGYWVGQSYARRGYARAAVGSLIDFAFGPLGLHRLEAAVQAGNHGSVSVLEATGFQKEGCARGFLKIAGRWTDHDIYARLRDD